MQKDSKRPDIEIKQDKSILVYIEIKHDSPLHTGQLEDYHKLLSNSGIPCCRLVLLTRSRSSLTETVLPRQDFHHVCWYEVYEWFAALDTGDAVCQYLIADFRSFLEQKDMNLQKVTWEDGQATLAQLNLSDMLKAATKETIVLSEKTGHKKASC